MISEVVANLAECIDVQPALHSSTLNFSGLQSQRAPITARFGAGVV